MNFIQVYEGLMSDEKTCIYHSGTAVFHEGMKFWSCCEKKTTDFGAFMEQKGCTAGKHNWSKVILMNIFKQQIISWGQVGHVI